MFARLWHSHRALIGLLGLAAALRLAVLWRYAPMLDEDRDLYRLIAEQVVVGKGFSRPYYWDSRQRPISLGRPPQLALLPLSINQPAPPVKVPSDATEDRFDSTDRDQLPVFFVKDADPDLPADLAMRESFNRPTAYRPPLYPLLIAGTLALFKSHRAIAIVHLLLGLSTVWLTVVAARRMRLERIANFAGLLVAVDPLLLYHTPQVMTETLAAFLVSALLAVAPVADSWRKRILLGGLLGLACLCRPTFFVVVALWMAGEFLTGWGTNRRASVQKLVCTAALLMAVILPWGIRNRVTLNHWIFATTHGGYTLLLGHNDTHTRLVVNDDDWESYNRFVPMLPWLFQKDLSWNSHQDFEYLLDRGFSAAAVESLRNHPIDAVRSGLTLWRRLWSLVPLQTAGIPPILRTGIGLFYGVTFMLAFLGLLTTFRTGWSPWLPALALLVGFAAVHFFYWADMRMRAPLTPAIALLATRGGVRCLRNRPG